MVTDTIAVRSALFGATIFLLLLLAGSSPAHAGEGTLSNDHYAVRLNEDLRLHVKNKTGGSFECRPTFTIIAADTNPKLKNRPAGIKHVNHNVVSWEVDPARL